MVFCALVCRYYSLTLAIHWLSGGFHLGMLTDIRINPDNKLSGYIQIINYPFNYPSTWRLIIFMYFLYSLSKFLRYFTKNFVHKYTSNPKY